MSKLEEGAAKPADADDGAAGPAADPGSEAAAPQQEEEREPAAEPQQQQQQQQQPEEPKPAAPWSWGFASNALAQLNRAAAGAAQVLDLLEAQAKQASAQQEQAASPPASRRAATSGAPAQPPAACSAPQPQDPPDRAALQAGAAAGPSGQDAEGASTEIQAAEAGAPATTDDAERADQELERGLQAIDEQMERLGGVVSNWWRGLDNKVDELVAGSGVTEDITQLQEAAASGARGVATHVQSVGRTALELLNDVMATYALDPTFGALDDPEPEAGAAKRGGERGEGSGAETPEELGAHQYFALYGGQQVCEELEALANECAHICNKGRAKLEGPQQAELDATLAALGPVFSEPLEGSSELLDGHGAQALEQLKQRLEPIQALCEDSHARAQAFNQQVLVAAAATAASPQAPDEAAASAAQVEPVQAGKEGAPGTAGTAPQEGRTHTVEGPGSCSPGGAAAGGRRGGGKKGARKARAAAAAAAAAAAEAGQGAPQQQGTQQQGAQQQEEGGPSAPGAAEGPSTAPAQAEPCQPGPSAVLEALAGLRLHAHKRLAEISSAQLQLLRDHAVALSAPARSLQYTPDGIDWPASPTQQARCLHAHCARMLGSLRGVAAAYEAVPCALLGALGEGEEGAAAAAAMSQPHTEGVQMGAGPRAAAQEAAPGGGSTDDARAAALALRAELRAAALNASQRTGEAFRGLLFCLVVRHLVLHIAAATEAAAGGSDEPRTEAAAGGKENAQEAAPVAVVKEGSSSSLKE